MHTSPKFPYITKYLLPRTTTTNASELRAELAWCAILLSTIVTPTVIVAVTTRGAVSAFTTAGSRLRRAGADGLAMCLRDNFCGKVEPLAEVLNALGGECVIVPLP